MNLILLLLSCFVGDETNPPDAFTYYIGDRPFYTMIAVDVLQEHIRNLDDFNPDIASSIVPSLSELSEVEQEHALPSLTTAIKRVQEKVSSRKDLHVYLRDEDKACFYKTNKESHWKTYPDEMVRLQQNKSIYSGQIVAVRPYFSVFYQFRISLVATVLVDQNLKNGSDGEPRKLFVIIPQGSALLGDLLFCTRAMGLDVLTPEPGAGILVFSPEPQETGSFVHVGVDGLVYEGRGGEAVMRSKFRRSGKDTLSFAAYRDLTAAEVIKEENP